MWPWGFTNEAEASYTFNTFLRVWGSGGHAQLHMETRGGKVYQRLELHLGQSRDLHPAPMVGRRLATTRNRISLDTKAMTSCGTETVTKSMIKIVISIVRMATTSLLAKALVSAQRIVREPKLTKNGKKKLLLIQH